MLAPLDEEAAEVRQSAARAGTEVEEPSFFGMMKEMTLVGYYTSEIGMTQELQHLRAAGSFAGCMPLSEVGRSWA
jgi:gluconate 2-dehydrogenase gamma chain